MVYADILEKINKIEITCEEDLVQIDKFLDELGVYYKSENDVAYDSCGYEVWYYAYAFVYDGVPRLITGTYDFC